MIAAALFVAGLILGSFTTALAHRLPRGENWVSGRSECPGCGAGIRARDNIPVISWIVLRGRCRDCRERIRVRYPLTELATAALLAATYLIVGDDPWWGLALGLVLSLVLVAITLIDLDLRIIPNKITAAGAIAALVILALGDASLIPDHLLAAAIAGGVLFIVVLLYPRGMGMGDVKLVAMMGLFLGRAVGPGTLIGFAIGAVAGIGLIAARGAEARKQAIPFGPFLAAGGIAGLWFGDEIVDWYLDEFFPES